MCELADALYQTIAGVEHALHAAGASSAVYALIPRMIDARLRERGSAASAPSRP